MTFATRTIFILMLVLALAGELYAQETSTAGAGTTTASSTSTAETAAAQKTDTAATDETAGTSERNPYEVRNLFTSLLQRHPYELPMLLKLDPALLSNEAFMSGYPEVAAFVAKYPEIHGNPRFYLAEFPNPAQRQNVLGQIFEMFAVMAGIGVTVFALGWLLRTLIEQKRWKQLSRTQTEVHNKILDRFSTSEQVIEYIRTPAGTKFLESAPIPLHTEKPLRPQPNAPATRIMWSVQLGVVVAIAGLGMLLLSFRFDRETSQGLFAMGAIAFCIGAGFIASAAVSLMLSRRLGLWQDGGKPPSPIDDSGPVR